MPRTTTANHTQRVTIATRYSTRRVPRAHRGRGRFAIASGHDLEATEHSASVQPRGYHNQTYLNFIEDRARAPPCSSQLNSSARLEPLGVSNSFLYASPRDT